MVLVEVHVCHSMHGQHEGDNGEVVITGQASVKSGSTPVRGPVKSRQKRTKEESRGLDKRLVWPELVTTWIQRLRITSVDPLRRFRCHAPNRFGTVNMEDNINIKQS